MLKFLTSHLHATIVIQQIIHPPIIEGVDMAVEILGTIEDEGQVVEDADLVVVGEDIRDNSAQTPVPVHQTGEAAQIPMIAPSVSTAVNLANGHMNVVRNLSIRRTQQINRIHIHILTLMLQLIPNPLRNPILPRANHVKPQHLLLISTRELAAMLGLQTLLMNKPWMTLFGKLHVH